MTEFNCYAKELDDLVNTIGADYLSKERAYNDAMKPVMPDADPSKEKVKQLKRAAALEEAKQAFDAIKKETPGKMESGISSIRARLQNAAEEAFTAKPEQVDGNAIQLINSGILSVQELVKLFNDALTKRNYTMARMIAAAKIAEDTETRPQMALLRTAANGLTAEHVLSSYDELASVARRCIANPGLYAYWEQVTHESIAGF